MERDAGDAFTSRVENHFALWCMLTDETEGLGTTFSPLKDTLYHPSKFFITMTTNAPIKVQYFGQNKQIKMDPLKTRNNEPDGKVFGESRSNLFNEVLRRWEEVDYCLLPSH